MLKYSQMRGAIFDVDETLLDNHPDGTPFGLHEQSRLAAAHALGKKLSSAGLIAFTPEQSTLAFRQAKVHTLHAAVWEMLIMAGEVPEGELDLQNELLCDLVALKEELHEDLLVNHAREVPGALKFVKGLAMRGLSSQLAVASTACRRDIDLFFTSHGFAAYFPDERIISREKFTRAKPDPEPFNMAFETLGLPEADRPFVAAFEDDPRGIQSAKTAGLFTCAIATRFTRQELSALGVAPDLIADSYEEFDHLFSE